MTKSTPTKVYVKPHGRKFMAIYAFTSKHIKKVITAQQLTELRTDPEYAVKQ